MVVGVVHFLCAIIYRTWNLSDQEFDRKEIEIFAEWDNIVDPLILLGVLFIFLKGVGL